MRQQDLGGSGGGGGMDDVAMAERGNDCGLWSYSKCEMCHQSDSDRRADCDNGLPPPL